MTGFFSALRIALIDMRADMRRFVLLIACLAVGTALIAGVSSVGASIKEAVDHNAAELMGGNIELSRADRAANPDELALMRQYGQVAAVIDTLFRALPAETAELIRAVQTVLEEHVQRADARRAAGDSRGERRTRIYFDVLPLTRPPGTDAAGTDAAVGPDAAR